jgi:hypothetical protein
VKKIIKWLVFAVYYFIVLEAVFAFYGWLGDTDGMSVALDAAFVYVNAPVAIILASVKAVVE